MTEVEKLYSLAGVEKECKIHTIDWQSFKEYYYSPFTAEKQLELIKLLQRKNSYKFCFSSTNDNSEYLFFAYKDNTPVQELIVAGNKCYKEALAGFINTLWQDLTEEEQEQIREILK